jgi:hypothetical protein
LLEAATMATRSRKSIAPITIKFTKKMSKEEVQAILGPPTSTSTEDKIIYKRTTWRYAEGDKYINLTFKNNELDSKDTNLGTK